MSRVDEKLRRSGGRKADRRRRSPGRAIRPTVEALERYELLATLIYNVTTASDSFFEPPIGSLREAITLANANVGVGDDAEIRFQIPGAEVHTIAVDLVGLPTVRVPTLIDGRSQGGVGYAGAPLIVIDNASANGDNGLELAGTASGSTLRGLSIVNARRDGEFLGGSAIYLDVQTTGVTIAGNYLGLLPDGTTAAGNEVAGVFLMGSGGNTVGGSTVADRNVIAGNGLAGVIIVPGSADGQPVPADDNEIRGNYIGTDATGSLDVGNGYGIALAGVSSTAILFNVISGNSRDGILLTDEAADVDPNFSNQSVFGSDNEIYGNYIGTDATGLVALGNDGDGIRNLFSSGTIIGGYEGNENVIAANGEEGIDLYPDTDATLVGFVIRANLIGVFVDGSGDRGSSGNTGIGIYAEGTSGILIDGNTVKFNGSDGIALDSAVGDAATITGNISSFNDFDGIYIDASTSAPILIRGNTFEGNGYAGVETGASNVTIGGPDPGDGNVIAFNEGPGVALFDSGYFPTGVRITVAPHGTVKAA